MCFYSKLTIVLKPTACLLLSMWICVFLTAQKKNQAFQLHIQQAVSTIQIDGAPDETAWQQADSTGHFFMVLPMDTSLANVQTVVKMTYDSRNLYLLAICYN